MTQLQQLGQDQETATSIDQMEVKAGRVHEGLNQKPHSLKALARLIANDARNDSIHYLLRSNTSHDGE